MKEMTACGTTSARTAERRTTAAAPTATRRSAWNSRVSEPSASAAAAAMIGPISGATIMAPMTVAVEADRRL